MSSRTLRLSCWRHTAKIDDSSPRSMQTNEDDSPAIAAFSTYVRAEHCDCRDRTLPLLWKIHRQRQWNLMWVCVLCFSAVLFEFWESTKARNWFVWVVLPGSSLYIFGCECFGHCNTYIHTIDRFIILAVVIMWLILSTILLILLQNLCVIRCTIILKEAIQIITNGTHAVRNVRIPPNLCQVIFTTTILCKSFFTSVPPCIQRHISCAALFPDVGQHTLQPFLCTNTPYTWRIRCSCNWCDIFRSPCQSFLRLWFHIALELFGCRYMISVFSWSNTLKWFFGINIKIWVHIRNLVSG